MEVFTGQEKDILFRTLIELRQEGELGYRCSYK
jgi:hypothetical protein